MDLRRVDLNLLVALDALLDECSVTRAAERLYVGQSAMSATLSRLRALFNDPILVRQGRRLVATPVAESLVGPIRQILASVSATLARCGTFDPLTDSRTFSIVASDYLTFVFLKPLLPHLSREAPHVRLHIRPVDEEGIQELYQNKTDLLITVREAFPKHLDFPHEELFSDRYVCAVDADHPEVREEITLEQFQSLPYLATSAGHSPSVADMQLDRLGIYRHTEITTSFTLGFFLLPGTELVSLVHERLGQAFERQLRIRLLEPPFKLAPITEIMIWSQRNTDDPGHCWLRRRLKALAGELFT
jgi:DNA-binding transcriptional LysR family regulator